MNRGEMISKIEELAGAVAATAADGQSGLEIVEVELKGSGRNHLVRVFIDKPGGVTHGDCEFFSRALGESLDEADPLPGTYELEVSSPGVERKLKKWQDWERFTGQKAKVVLKEPLKGDLKHFEGKLAGAVLDETGARTITVELANGKAVTFSPEQVDRANLKFEW